MNHHAQFFIDGGWVDPVAPASLDVVDPSTERAFTAISLMAYRGEDEAVRIANDTVYGLAAYVSSADIDHARAIAARLRAGTVNLNYPAWDVHAPFGGFKQSGNGREYADFGTDDYLDLKAVVGYR